LSWKQNSGNPNPCEPLGNVSMRSTQVFFDIDGPMDRFLPWLWVCLSGQIFKEAHH
jgi:hypothetical protein